MLMDIYPDDNSVLCCYILAIILYFSINYNTDTECMRAIASTLIHAVVLCESAQRYRALMVILQSHRTQNMILRCYPNVAVCYTSETYQILSPVLFQQSLYFPFLIHRIFYLLASALFLLDSSNISLVYMAFLHSWAETHVVYSLQQCCNSVLTLCICTRDRV